MSGFHPKLIDLTRTVHAKTRIDLAGKRSATRWTVPDFELEWVRDWSAGDNGSQCLWQISDHFGTHVDAPIHTVPATHDVSQMDLNRLFGEAVVLDCTFARGRGLGAGEFEQAGALVRPGDIVLIYSGEPIGSLEAYVTDQTYVTTDGAQWLVDHGVVCVGVEASSFEHVYDRLVRNDSYRRDVEDPWPAHRVCLSQEVYIIEGLTNLDEIAGERVNFCALPLPVPGGSGSPVRAVAWRP